MVRTSAATEDTEVGLKNCYVLSGIKAKVTQNCLRLTGRKDFSNDALCALCVLCGLIDR